MDFKQSNVVRNLGYTSLAILIEKKAHAHQTFFVSIAFVTMFCVTMYCGNRDRIQQQDGVREKSIEMLEMLNNDKENLYLVTVFSSGCYDQAFGIWDVVPQGCYSNLYELGGWGTGSPQLKEIRDRYYVNNPFRDVVNRSDIYLMDFHIDTTVEYIRRHYASDAYPVLCKQINGGSIYRILSQPITFDDALILQAPPNLLHDFDWKVVNGSLSVEGWAYFEGTSSYKGSAYVALQDNKGNNTYYQMTQYENDGLKGDLEGQYSSYVLTVDTDLSNMRYLKIFYQNGDNIYSVSTIGL